MRRLKFKMLHCLCMSHVMVSMCQISCLTQHCELRTSWLAHCISQQQQQQQSGGYREREIDTSLSLSLSLISLTTASRILARRTTHTTWPMPNHFLPCDLDFWLFLPKIVFTPGALEFVVHTKLSYSYIICPRLQPIDIPAAWVTHQLRRWLCVQKVKGQGPMTRKWVGVVCPF